MEERIQIGLEIIEKICANNKKNLTDAEKMDLAVRVGQGLFIEKNKSYRSQQIESRYKD